MRTRALLIVVPFLLDVVTKALVYFFVPEHSSIPLFGDWSLTMQLNHQGFSQRLAGWGIRNAKVLVAISVLIFFWAIEILIVNKTVKRRWIRILSYIAGELAVGTLLGWYVGSPGPALKIDPVLLGIVSKLGSLTLGVVVLICVKDKGYLILWSLFVAAGLGNLSNSLFPPFAVIDFLFSESAYEAMGIGVFNLADAMIDLFVVSIFVYSLVKLIWRGPRKRVVRNTPPESSLQTDTSEEK